jgi:hypothetical protein
LGLTICLMVFHFFRRLFLTDIRSRDRIGGDAVTFTFFQLRIPFMNDHSAPSNSLHSIPSCSLSSNDINVAPPSILFPSTMSFGNLLSDLMRLACALTILCLLFTLPLYVLKQLDVESGDEGDPQYVTHSHMYNWLWTMAFLSGTTPAVIILSMCLVCLFYFTFVLNHLGGATKLPSVSFKRGVPDIQTLQTLTVWMIFLLNLGVVVTVNGLYLWSSLLDLASDVRIWIQFSFGLFSFLWSIVLRNGLPSKIKESQSGVWLFTCLNVMNSVLIPCIVTALSSPSCYQVC